MTDFVTKIFLGLLGTAALAVVAGIVVCAVIFSMMAWGTAENPLTLFWGHYAVIVLGGCIPALFVGLLIWLIGAGLYDELRGIRNN